MQFKGTKNYISTEDLSMAVNAARALERPLLVKGEPGTGKTRLAQEIADKFKIPVCVDGTQGAAHLKTDMQELGCDFYAFSAHKMYGPTGLGLLYVKYKWLEAFDPFIGGGGMIDFVSKDDVAYAKGVWKFEAGTMPTAEVVALKESINFINQII